jgi:hypothetical protein
MLNDWRGWGFDDCSFSTGSCQRFVGIHCMFRCVRSACDISRILADGLSVISDLFHRVLFKELPHYVVCRDIHGGPTQCFQPRLLARPRIWWLVVSQKSVHRASILVSTSLRYPPPLCKAKRERESELFRNDNSSYCGCLFHRWHREFDTVGG